MAASTIDLSRLIDGQKFNRFHIWIIFWCFLVQFADGFDINAAAYIAPALVKEWHLNRAQLGPLFSAGLSAGFLVRCSSASSRTVTVAGCQLSPEP